MKSKKTTIEGEREQHMKALCDQILHRAACMMVEEVGVSVSVMLDRMLTYSAAQACSIDGSANTAVVFRVLADRIDAGLFHSVTGENDQSGSKH